MQQQCNTSINAKAALALKMNFWGRHYIHQEQTKNDRFLDGVQHSSRLQRLIVLPPKANQAVTCTTRPEPYLNISYSLPLRWRV